MTGEITLRGHVLPIGGLTEKLLAARRAGIHEVMIPMRNKRDLADMPAEVKDKMDIRPVLSMDEVLKRAMGLTAVETDIPAIIQHRSPTQPGMMPV